VPGPRPEVSQAKPQALQHCTVSFGTGTVGTPLALYPLAVLWHNLVYVLFGPIITSSPNIREGGQKRRVGVSYRKWHGRLSENGSFFNHKRTSAWPKMEWALDWKWTSAWSEKDVFLISNESAICKRVPISMRLCLGLCQQHFFSKLLLTLLPHNHYCNCHCSKLITKLIITLIHVTLAQQLLEIIY